MCHSYINAARQFDFKLNIACPYEYRPNQSIVDAAGSRIAFFNHPEQAAAQADLVVTDVWASMGQEDEQKKREIAFQDFQVNQQTMQAAHPDALFMHCLPAYHNLETKIGKEIFDKFGMNGLEVTEEVFEAPYSIVFDEAENRVHTIKAVMVATLGS